MDRPRITLEAVQREIYKREYYRFFLRAWDIIEPGTEFIDNWHVKYLCDILQEEITRIAAGKPKKQDLIINIPPRSAKSSIVTMLLNAWAWINYPHLKFITASYAATLATSHSRKTRDVIESPWYQASFPSAFHLKHDTNRADEFENNLGGVRKAVGSGGTITGAGGDVIIADDPLDPESAYSDTERETVNRWWNQTMYSRLNNQKIGLRIIVMQRLHEEDLTGTVLKKLKGKYRLIKIPGEINSDNVSVKPKDLEAKYKKGLFFPTRYDTEILEGYKESLGSMGYANQISQSGTPTDGTIYKRPFFRRRWKVLPARFDEVVQSWDFAFKDLKTSDFVAGQVWGRKGAMYFLIYRLNEKLDFVASVAAVKSVSAMYPQATRILIEDKANGPAIISSLKSKISGIIPVKAEKSKVARAHATTPVWESGNVILPSDPGTEDFVEQHIKFPKSKNDDEVDASNQALNHFIKNKPKSSVLGGMGKQ